MNKTKIIAFCLLGLVLIDVSSVYWDEYYKKRDDEPVNNQLFKVQSFTTIGTASGTISTTTTT